MVLESTQRLIEMSTRDLPWGVKETDATFTCQLSENPGSLSLLEPKRKRNISCAAPTVLENAVDTDVRLLTQTDGADG
jgi:hypothetical protein